MSINAPYTVIGHYRDDKEVKSFHVSGTSRVALLENLESRLDFGRPFTVTSILGGYRFDVPAGIKETIDLCNEVPGPRAWLRQ